jgi:hypothetical protein
VFGLVEYSTSLEFKMVDLTENEKQTIISALTYISQGLTVDQREEFNHLANIVEKLKENTDADNSVPDRI